MITTVVLALVLFILVLRGIQTHIFSVMRCVLYCCATTAPQLVAFDYWRKADEKVVLGSIFRSPINPNLGSVAEQS